MWDNGVAQVMKMVLQIITRPWTKTVKLQSPSLQSWRMQGWPQKMTWKVWGMFCLCFLLSFFIWSKAIRKINICSSPTCISHARRPMVLHWSQSKMPCQAAIHSPSCSTHLSSILVLALSSFARIWGSWVSSSQAEPQPRTRARSFPVPRGSTPSWHWWKTVRETCP